MGVAITGADYSQWKPAENVFKTSVVKRNEKVENEKDDDILSNKCTDGKDDGKIGFFNAMGHVVKGAATTLVDTVKGCFTDENGDLSIGKTLFTVGTAAACIAFPPLGLAACAAGVAVGGVNMAKGIYNAASAKTDAEAKKAWQEVGGGALTAGASAVGAKASLGAVKASAKSNGGSALEALEENASLADKASALAKDSWSSTKNGAKSVKNTVDKAVENYKINSKASKTAKLKDVKISDEEALISENWDALKQINELRKAKNEALAKTNKSPEDIEVINKWNKLKNDMKLTDEAEQEIIQVEKFIKKSELKTKLEKAKKDNNPDDVNKYTEELKKYAETDEEKAIMEVLNKMKNTSEIAEENALKIHNYNKIKEMNKLREAKDAAQKKPTIEQTQSDVEAITKWNNLKLSESDEKALIQAGEQIKKAELKEKLKIAKENNDEATINSVKAELDEYSSLTKLKNGISETADKSEAYKVSKSFTNGVEDTTGIINKIKTFKDNLTKENFNALYKALGADGKAILAALQKNNPESVISKYGYENVAAVLKAGSGMEIGSQAV